MRFLKPYKVLLLLVLLLLQHVAIASCWTNWWWRRDQQAYRAFQSGDMASAEVLFDSPDWQAVAQYRNQHFNAAEKVLEKETSALADYNRGNALAHLGQYRPAIESYEQALKLNPDYPDAKHNIAVLKKLLEKQASQKQSEKAASSDNSSQADKKDKSKALNNASQANKPTKQSPKPEEVQQEKTVSATASAADVRQSKKTLNSPPSRLSEKDKGQEALKQWLKQVPDDPGGLLRHKFMRDYQRRHGLEAR